MPTSRDFPPHLRQWLAFLADEAKKRPSGNLTGPDHRSYEQDSTGVDEALQGIGSDGYGTLNWVGLRWPPHASALPSEPSPLGIGRYLMVCSTVDVAEGERKRIRGTRMTRTLGAIANAGSIGDPSVTPRPTELEVNVPFWRFPDSGFSLHLRELSPTLLQSICKGPGPFDTQNFAFRMSKTPALLYEKAAFAAHNLSANGKPDFYVNLTGYVPPNKGRPWGQSLGHWGTFYGARSPTIDSHAWTGLDIKVEGPCTVALFASCWQTNPATRTALPAPTYVAGINQPEAFVLNYPDSSYEWRFGATLICEDL